MEEYEKVLKRCMSMLLFFGKMVKLSKSRVETYSKGRVMWRLRGSRGDLVNYCTELL